MPRVAQELLAHHPDSVQRPVVGQVVVFFTGVCHALDNKKAPAVAGFYQPLGGQVLVGGDHGIFRMTVQAHVFA
ncbi:hypothetical protein D3C84_1100770 [compost metagenome]